MLGSSLFVPPVQELAKDKSSPLPARYVRSDQEPVFSSSVTSLEVPVIDMKILIDEDLMEAELNKLHHACKDWGFFQLINHGISDSLVEILKTETKEFYKLPLEEKNKFRQIEGDVQGYGQLTVVSDDQKLEWADIFYMITLPKNLRQPHLFQQFSDSFRNAIDDYAMEAKSLALKLLKLMAKALGMKEEEMTTLFEEGLQSMKMNYYPPCHQPDQVLGVVPHSDGDALTFLFQVNETDGLQVKKDGVWVPVRPLPSAIVVNVGDVMEVVSNGIYPSIEHRAIVDSANERMTFATFFNPNPDAEFGPSPSLLSAETPAKYARIGATEFIQGVFSRKLDGKSSVDFLKI